MRKVSGSKVLHTLRKARTFVGATGQRIRSRSTRQVRKQLAAGVDSASSAPVFFIVGQQKSGTTWLMRMLDAHPEILCKGEGRFFGAGWRQENIKESNDLRPASSLYNALLDSEYLRVWVDRSIWSRHENADEHLDNLTRLAVDYFLKNELVKTGKKMVGDKSPLLSPDTIKEISRIYPEAKVIHIIRDGRDAAVSALHHSRNFGSGNPAPKQTGESRFSKNQLRKLAADWRDRVGRTVEEGPTLLGENYREVRYEDLLKRPEVELRLLIEFLGAAVYPETLSRCVAATSFEKLSRGRERGQEDATSFFRKGVAGDWKNTFTDQDRETFKREAGELLVKLGYEEDDGW